MGSTPIQLQWELARTTSSTLSIARGFMRAATSDNVQPLALVACERFGATLAMCPETCKKIASLVERARMPPAIAFSLVTIGYSAGDCASQLLGSLAGIQFLALAAALVTTVGAYDGGNALETMLKSSAADKTLLPTARHLKDLLAGLEHRCVRSGFADTVIGWQIFLSNLPQTTGEFARFWKTATRYPSPDGLERLVDAFRQLSRIGDATSITLKTAACTPWVVAFIKWCLGIPPSIYLDDGTPLLEQPAARVALIASKKTDDYPGIEITIHRGVETPADLIVSSLGSNPFSGMLSIKCYGQWLRQEYDLEAGHGRYEAIAQALPYALEQAATLLQLSWYQKSEPYLQLRRHKLSYKSKQPDEDVLRLATNPLAKDSFILATLSRILGSSEPSQLPSMKEGVLIGDLPAVVLHRQYLEQHCPCLDCDSVKGISYGMCEVKKFFLHLTYLVADVLALSLFDDSETLLVHLNRPRPGSYTFETAIN